VAILRRQSAEIYSSADHSDGKAKPRVLIVDDERLIADTLAEILSDKGFEAAAVYNPRRALEQIRELCPDIVITDVVMPGMNGIELAKVIRKSCPDTRILLLSGQAATAELIERAKHEGYSFEMLAKPIGPETLLQRCEEVISEAASMWRISTSMFKVDLEQRHWSFRYGCALLLVALALLLNSIPAAHSLPFIFSFAAVTLSARVCGFGPALLATAVSAVVADYFFLLPRFEFAHTSSNLFRLLFFVLVSLLISSIAKQRSKLERNAEQQRAQLAAIFESSDDAILTKTMEGIITTWNRGAERLYGYKPEEIVGKNVAQLAPPERQKEMADIMEKLSRGERIDHYETIRLRKDRSRIHISLSVSPLFDGEKIFGASSIARDITARKLSEEALRKAEKLATAGRLSATLAHELNNPLEAITNLLYIVRNSDLLDEKSKRRLDLADEELARVAHMTKQTLGFYRDSSSAGPLDLGKIMDEVLVLYTRKLESKEIEVRKRYCQSANVMAFAGEIRQVFSNLIGNAIDAMTESDSLSLKIANSRKWNNADVAGVRVTILDSGSGIEPALKPRLFEPFYTTKSDIGTGLGLWLSKELVGKHGGSISVRSSVRPGMTGTAFSIFLPVTPPAHKRSEAA
jgi:PAS domain S-box-containing protein